MKQTKKSTKQIESFNNDKSKLESTRTGTFNQRTNELRGVWVASVINIDWPSKKGLSVESQKREYIQILENGLYTRTPFVDMEFPNDLSVKLRSIAPFAGRLCLYDLMKGSETNV